MAEPLATNIVFLDTVQRYKALMDKPEWQEALQRDKISVIEQLFAQASHDNNLLAADEKPIMAEAWSRFLRKHPTEKVEHFIQGLSTSDMHRKIDDLPALAPIVGELTNGKAAGFMVINFLDLMVLRKALRQVSQASGIVDYEAGNVTLPEIIDAIADSIRKEREQAPAAMPVEPSASEPQSGLPAALTTTAARSTSELRR